MGGWRSGVLGGGSTPFFRGFFLTPTASADPMSGSAARFRLPVQRGTKEILSPSGGRDERTKPQDLNLAADGEPRPPARAFGLLLRALDRRGPRHRHRRHRQGLAYPTDAPRLHRRRRS